MTVEVGEGRTVPLRGARGMIADKMVASLRDAAQLTHHARADVSALLAAKEALAQDGVKASVEDLMMAAVVRVLKRHPDINGVVRDRTVHLSERIDLCVAIALPGNLLAAPAIFDAGGKSVAELRAARQDLSARAKTNKLSVAEMTGGTFTISNGGVFGSLLSTPILNPPQSAILGMHRIEKRPIVDEKGEIVVRPMMYLALTYDHRIIDGREAVTCLRTMKERLEDPSRILLEV